MAATGPDPTPLVESLRSLRRSGLVAVALFALGIGVLAFRSGAAPSSDVNRPITYAALALASISILARRTPGSMASPRLFVWCQVASVLGAVGLGLLGALLALRGGQWQVGLLYNLAAFLLLFRPVRLVPAPPRRG